MYGKLISDTVVGSFSINANLVLRRLLLALLPSIISTITILRVRVERTKFLLFSWISSYMSYLKFEFKFQARHYYVPLKLEYEFEFELEFKFKFDTTGV